jgi:hypothetical protein
MYERLLKVGPTYGGDDEFLLCEGRQDDEVFTSFQTCLAELFVLTLLLILVTDARQEQKTIGLV